MRHQAHIVFDERVSGLQVTLGAALQTGPLLLWAEGLGERADVSRQVQ